MIMVETMDVDLSVVKKERMDLDGEYGNILDNFTTENDYDSFPNTNSISCTEDEDVNVDWLTSFFDEPTHDTMSGLNPPLSDISESGTTFSRITSINCTSDILLDSYPTFSEDYEATMPMSETTNNTEHNVRLSPKISPTVCSSNNPFLSQSHCGKNNSKDIVLGSLKSHQEPIKIKTEDTSIVNELASKDTTSATQFVINNNNNTDTKPQQKLLLFMNTPENRAKLAGTNFNIINANLLSKISGSQQNMDTNSNNINLNSNNVSRQTMNLINLKKCIRLNNTVRSKEDSLIKQSSDDTVTASTVNATLQSIMAANHQKEKKILPVDILNGHTYGLMRKDRDSHEVDSGYESPTSSSSGSSPCSPPIELSDRKDGGLSEHIQYIDIPPHERQPFYLSEEEKRTLIMEGLPIPQGLPLNKSEERALKKVRRKIKNKISAQESRRKKKEYMESLEKKVDCYASENSVLKKKVGSLEVANRSLIMQVQKLQALVTAKISPPSPINSTDAKHEIIDVEQ